MTGLSVWNRQFLRLDNLRIPLNSRLRRPPKRSPQLAIEGEAAFLRPLAGGLYAIFETAVSLLPIKVVRLVFLLFMTK